MDEVKTFIDGLKKLKPYLTKDDLIKIVERYAKTAFLIEAGEFDEKEGQKMFDDMKEIFKPVNARVHNNEIISQ